MTERDRLSNAIPIHRRCTPACTLPDGGGEPSPARGTYACRIKPTCRFLHLNSPFSFSFAYDILTARMILGGYDYALYNAFGRQKGQL